MKKLFTLAVLLLATATTASAQFATGKSGGSKGGNTASTENWKRIFVSYNAISIEKQDPDGFSLGYAHSFNIARSLPLFIEIAPHVTYGFATIKSGDMNFDFDFDDYDFDDDDYDTSDPKISYLGVNIPVNVAYKFAIGNSDFSLVPYLGLNFRVNVLAQYKAGDYKLNYFNKNDMGEDGKFKRFQLGGQVGLGFNYKHLYAGVGYGFDFMELAKKTKMSVVSISLGYNF